MSYGIFSEVYFATSTFSKTTIKIGETTNARRRASQLLSQESYRIILVADVDGDEAERLFVESFLRARIKASGKAHQIRKDYFECDCYATVEQFTESFNSWVAEANAILAQMKAGKSLLVQPTFKNDKPIIPEGREKFYNEIIMSCDRLGYWKECYQFDTETQYERFTQMQKTLTPYGYVCTTYRNCSWAYFKVEKKFI